MGVHVFPILKPLPPPSPSHPPGLSQCTGFECLVSCIEFELVIYFTHGNIHVSMIFSLIIPPSHSPRVQKSVLYICVSFAALHIGSSFTSVQSLSVSDALRPMDCSTPGLPVHSQLPEFPQTHVHWVSDAIQPSHPLSSPSPPAFNLQ